MTKLQIVIVLGPFFPIPPGPAGAVERRWADTAQKFAAQGHLVTVICRDSPELPPPGTRNNVEYIYVRGSRQTGFVYIDIIKEFIYSLRVIRRMPKNDIVMLNSFWLPIMSFWLHRYAKIVACNVARMPKGQFHFYGGLDALFAVSTATGAAVGQIAPGLSTRTVVVPNPVNIEAFQPPELPRILVRGQPATLLFTGRIHREKGIHVLVAAVRQLAEAGRSVRLRVIGPHETDRGGSGDEYLQELRQLAQGLEVEFCAPIYDRRLLCAQMHQAHVYCYPSLAERGETFGVAPLEAMATGLPVIVSRLACFSDFLQEGVTGLTFDHHRTDAATALAEQVVRLLDDADLYHHISERGAACALGFSTEAVAMKYAQEFVRLINDRVSLKTR